MASVGDTQGRKRVPCTFRVVEPVLTEQRFDLVADHIRVPAAPGVGVGQVLRRPAEVAVTDLESLAQLRVFPDLPVQGLEARGDPTTHRLRHAAIGEVAIEALATEGRLDGREGETPPQRVVHQCEGAVSGVHRADQMEIRRDVERMLIGARIGSANRPRGIALVGLDQHQQLAADPAQVAAVDLVDDQHIRTIRCFSGARRRNAETVRPAGRNRRRRWAGNRERSPRIQRTGGIERPRCGLSTASPVSSHARRCAT